MNSLENCSLTYNRMNKPSLARKAEFKKLRLNNPEVTPNDKRRHRKDKKIRRKSKIG